MTEVSRPTRAVRFVNAAQRARPDLDPWAGVTSAPGMNGTNCAAGWHPTLRLGASTTGLALPDAHPTAAWLYAPRGVTQATVGGHDVLVAADTGNHRVLVWHDFPTRDEQPCDVVVGQPDPTSEGPAAGGSDTRAGMNLPTGLLIVDGMLLVADAWHHRILVYRSLPDRPGAIPDLVLGQPDPESTAPNRGGEPDATSFYWPFGIALVDGVFYVADTGNRRVLGWSTGIPDSPDVPADVVLGQPDPAARAENRGGSTAADSFRWPHAIAGTGRRLYVADAGNHRLLGWTPAPLRDRPADAVLGQRDYGSAEEWPYPPQRADSFRFPYAVDVAVTGGLDQLVLADTANNRILWWDGLPTSQPPDAVLGQPDFTFNGENRWTGVADDSFCWPYGLSLSGDRLAVADSGNNRIMIWSRDRSASCA